MFRTAFLQNFHLIIPIAWDGSIGAARAVWNSIPLLRIANSIEIVTVVGEKELIEVPPANTLAAMLAYLGKKINVTVLTYDGSTAGGLIKQRAIQIGAGLIVQGAMEDRVGANLSSVA